MGKHETNYNHARHRSIIKNNKVAIISKTYCPFCTMAKEALNGTNYAVMEIENNPDCVKIQAYMQKLTGARTAPRVFINGKCIGGGTETASLARSGKLKKMIG